MRSEMANKKEVQWINCAKAVAIIGVLIDHGSYRLGVFQQLAITSYYSVTLFILIAGILAYQSISRHGFSLFHSIYWSTKKIVFAYLIAALAIGYIDDMFISIKSIISGILRFNIQGPFYFVALYIQLMVISKPLYHLINYFNSFIKHSFILILLIIVGLLSTKYTNILGIYGGGGKLFGGTYLPIFYLGMLVSSKILKMTNTILAKTVKIKHFVLGSFLWISSLIFVYKNGFKYDELIGITFINPPNITIMIYSIIVLYGCFGIFSFIQELKFLCIISSIFSFIGKHTLYIFLYHLFFMGKLSSLLMTKSSAHTARGIIIIAFSVILSIIIEYVINLTIAKVRSIVNT